ncbi:hypothetical protein MKK69_13000 [Methylobacterium sp. J-026]|uniref:hypothetical protein n=1 Tax=Methylobacterium sp. J-026 TaxID=2836624 RepID=UPI001FBC0745|nr:hypothetical protein [Methylobacterium sp. J-026]MCJ2134966.1 hypothetical protein [Methylobacterium sp. J-026]
MPAGPSTLADLRKAGVVTSQEIIGAIDVYLRDPMAGPYRFDSGHPITIGPDEVTWPLIGSRLLPVR